MLEFLVAGLLIGALFGAGYYLTIYGLEWIRTLWKIRKGDIEDL